MESCVAELCYTDDDQVRTTSNAGIITDRLVIEETWMRCKAR